MMTPQSTARRLSVALTCATILSVSPRTLANDGVAELLMKKGMISESEYHKLTATAPASPTVNFDQGVTLSSADGDSFARIGTFMQMDIAAYSDEDGDTDKLDNNSGTEMRRGRLYLTGAAHRDWQYKFEIELFASSGTQITDAYVRYAGFKPFAITTGHFKIPFGLEQLESDKDLPFMERSLSNAFLLSRAPGVMLSTGAQHWTASAMLFGEQLYNNTGEDEGGGASARITWAPITDNGVLHAGLDLQYREPTNISGGNTLRLRARPESHMTSVRLVDTGTIDGDVDNQTLYGLELAGAFGGGVYQAEYTQTDITRNHADDLSFDGWYAQGSWVLTGEKRAYKSGLFKGVKPDNPVGRGGIGAWEVALRYSQLDLNDGEVNGGKERNASFAVSWFLTRAARISCNWVHVLDVDKGTYSGAATDALQMRLQYAY